MALFSIFVLLKWLHWTNLNYFLSIGLNWFECNCSSAASSNACIELQCLNWIDLIVFLFLLEWFKCLTLLNLIWFDSFHWIVYVFPFYVAWLSSFMKLVMWIESIGNGLICIELNGSPCWLRYCILLNSNDWVAFAFIDFIWV